MLYRAIGARLESWWPKAAQTPLAPAASVATTSTAAPDTAPAQSAVCIRAGSSTDWTAVASGTIAASPQQLKTMSNAERECNTAECVV